MYDNIVNQFPDFTNFTSALTDINLGKNRIVSIPDNLLNLLTNLEILDLRENFLSAIPDVAGPQNTLRYLDISQNDFMRFPSLGQLSRSLRYLNIANNKLDAVSRTQIEDIPTLEVLDMSNNEMTSFPNLCTMSGDTTLNISLQGNPLWCDRKMVHLKLAETSGIIRLMTSGVNGVPTCDAPPRLQNESWYDVTVNDLVDGDGGKSHL
jgi:Leucine-rich repeat (LRR) protein